MFKLITTLWIDFLAHLFKTIHKFFHTFFWCNSYIPTHNFNHLSTHTKQINYHRKYRNIMSEEQLARKRAKEFIDKADGEMKTFWMWRSKGMLGCSWRTKHFYDYSHMDITMMKHCGLICQYVSISITTRSSFTSTRRFVLFTTPSINNMGISHEVISETPKKTKLRCNPSLNLFSSPPPPEPFTWW